MLSLALAGPFGQTFEASDIALVGLLALLEGVLSVDNALVLGLLAQRVEKPLQKRALTYGLVGAFAFRLIAVVFAAYILQIRAFKLAGGAYLIYIAAKHFLKPSQAGGSGKALAHAGFWSTVLIIELTDIAFAVDSIVAAIGLVSDKVPTATGTNPKLWIVLAGGFMGVVLMRFAAVVFIRLLEKFSRLESSAFLLVSVIGAKLVLEYFLNQPGKPHVFETTSPDSPWFYVFWGLMAGSFAWGFVPARKQAAK